MLAFLLPRPDVSVVSEDEHIAVDRFVAAPNNGDWASGVMPTQYYPTLAWAAMRLCANKRTRAW